MFARLIIVLALLPAILMAHLACVCAGESMLPAIAVQPMAADHSCCEGSDADATDAPSHPEDHAAHCPHCTGANPLKVAEPSTPPVPAIQPIFVAAIPSFIADVAFATPAGSRSAPTALPSVPPPDLLRVKCTLLI